MKAQHALLFVLVILLALCFINTRGTEDLDTYRQWAQAAEDHGLGRAYHLNAANYPPLGTVILLAVARLSSLFQLDTAQGIKLSLAVFLFMTSLVIWLWTRNLLLAAIVQLALILDSVAMGYIDIYCAPTFVASLWALKSRRWLLWTVLYAITCLIKWQPAIIAPVMLLYILSVDDLRDWKRIDFKGLILYVALPLLLILALVFSVFGSELVKALKRALNDPYLSGQALNFHWILTYILHVALPDTIGGLLDGRSEAIKITELLRPWRLWLGLGFYALYLTALITFFRREKSFENLLLYSLAGYLAYCMFNIGVHENHLFFASLLAAVLFAINRDHLPAFVAWTLAANINIFLFHGITGIDLPFSRIVGVDLGLPLSVVNVLLFVAFFAATVRRKVVLQEPVPVDSRPRQALTVPSGNS